MAKEQKAPFEFAFKQALKSYREQMGAGNRKQTKNLTPPNWLHPYSKEKMYYEKLKKEIFVPLNKYIWDILNVKLEIWLRETGNIKDRADDWVNDIEEARRMFMNKANVLVGTYEEMKGGQLWGIMGTVADETNTFNKKQWRKQTKRFLGQPFTTNEEWWEKTRKSWQQENFGLIRELANSEINNVKGAVYRGVREGKSLKDIKQDIEKETKSAKGNKAKKIARDQVGRLNGELTRTRQTEVGLDLYKWRTAKDERVRGRPGGKYPNAIPSHWAMDKKICRWDNNSLYADPYNDVGPNGRVQNWKTRTTKMPKTIPGGAILCRCVAIPYWQPTINEVDNEINS